MCFGTSCPLLFNNCIHAELIEHINSTSYNFDLGSLPMSGSRGRLIFRARALATTFSNGQSVNVIQNNGYSQIAWFDYNNGALAGFCTEIAPVSIDPQHSGTNYATVAPALLDVHQSKPVSVNRPESVR